MSDIEILEDAVKGQDEDAAESDYLYYGVFAVAVILIAGCVFLKKRKQ
ncbi:MAG: hypothetical protein J7K00_03835 [Candidatus Diapherotrites archaeon]|nr:hypothetical protein [Candidatus Diapherotrites archaeon]